MIAELTHLTRLHFYCP